MRSLLKRDVCQLNTRILRDPRIARARRLRMVRAAHTQCYRQWVDVMAGNERDVWLSRRWDELLHLPRTSSVIMSWLFIAVLH